MTVADRQVELSEAREVIRFCAGRLTAVERKALAVFLEEKTFRAAAPEVGLTWQGVWVAQERALRKMRASMERLGIRSSADLIGGYR